MNAMMAQFGSPADFDEWAEEIHDDNWSWKYFHKYFKKFETFVPHPQHPNVDVSLRGDKGPVTIGLFTSVTNSGKAFIEACVAVGMDYTPDFLMKSRGVSKVSSLSSQNI